MPACQFCGELTRRLMVRTISRGIDSDHGVDVAPPIPLALMMGKSIHLFATSSFKKALQIVF